MTARESLQRGRTYCAAAWPASLGLSGVDQHNRLKAGGIRCWGVFDHGVYIIERFRKRFMKSEKIDEHVWSTIRYLDPDERKQDKEALLPLCL
jgi:hypothetical protein